MDHDPTSGVSNARSEAVKAVERVAVRARMMRIAAACAALAMLVILSVSATAAVDALIRFPSILRGIFLCVIVGLVAVDLRKFVIPSLRFRPRPIEIAQRIERQRPELAGHLAAAVDFELTGVSRTNELAAFAVRNLEERAKGMDFGSVLKLRPTVLRVSGAVACVALAIGFAAVEPVYASIAVKRVLLPWSDAAWPARTAVESLMVDRTVAPKGTPVELRARLSKGDEASERVFARYRSVRDGAGVGEASAWTEVALSRQPDGAFSRLVDGDGDRLEFVFLTRDSETQVGSMRLVEPPAITAATLVAEPPAYAQRVMGARTEDLGSGADARATPRDPLLDGSRVRLELKLSRAIPFDAANPTVWMIGEATLGAQDGVVQEGMVQDGVLQEGATASSASADGGAAAAAASAVQAAKGVGPARKPVTPTIDPADPARWVIEFTARGPTRIEAQLVDADGIRQREPSVFAFDTVADRAPTAAIIDPAQDESVVADARVPMRAEQRDDLELRSAGIEIATRLGKAETDSLVFEERAEIAGPQPAASIERVLEIAKLQLAAGDSVVLRAFAEDHFDGLGASEKSHGRTRSAPRVIRIVGEEEFERQIRSSLSGVRRDAMRIDERQAKAREQVEKDPKDATLEQGQAAVTEGAARIRESAEQVLERLGRNGRAEGSLADIARQAEDIASAAEARSAEASEALERARKEAKTPEEREQRAADAKQAAERQDEVRAELEDLVGLLDRDEDAWAARRRLEGLTNRIRQLARETQQAAQRSNGESREQMSPDARAEIDALAERQASAAEEAEKTLSEMKERAKALEESDAQQARALDAAAKAAEDGRVREEMEQASKDSAQNKLEQSKAAQERALEALQKAAQELEQDRKVRAKELARMLEDLVEAIKRLIAETEGRRAELAGVPGGAGEPESRLRDPIAALFGVLSQNTRGVAADARARSREAARPARSLDSAATSLAAVASTLRARDFVREDAVAAADAALKHLDEALKLAEEASDRAEERAAEEKREELLQKYREFLEREVTLRDAAKKIIPESGKAIGRRELVESRRLGSAQEELREAVRRLLDAEEEVKGSDALADMHDVIDESLSDSRASLNDGKPGAAVPPADDAIEALAAIVGALDEKDTPNDEDAFAEQQNSGSDQGAGGQSPSGAVPPVAEVKLLRSMQDSLARRTRALDEAASSMTPVERAQRLGAIAARQQRILELGSKLAEKIRAGGSNANAGSGEAPGETDSGPSDGRDGKEERRP
ncbi:MAG: hypothetical protein NTU45_15340 [Planctomycetota bacterium]|nr:hypothetical protein [Planctomycetota bacterium]